MIILDTNVVSELMRPRASSHVINWMAEIPDKEVHITSVTQAEVRFGIALLPEGRRRVLLAMAADRLLAEDFAGRVLTFGPEAADRYGLLVAQRRRQGRPISVFDGMIAAIAQYNRAALATRNIDDFQGLGLSLLNPWASS
jgi:predicted nucleic acid-binding protein